MQYVNDDMDDIFRKAAEGYPLDTRGSDWDKVLAALNEQEKTPVKKTKDKRKFLWLLMLLPMGLVCNYYYNEAGWFGSRNAVKNGSSSGADKITTTEKDRVPDYSTKTVVQDAEPENFSTGTVNSKTGFSNDGSLKKEESTTENHRRPKEGATPVSLIGDASNSSRNTNSFQKEELSSGRRSSYTSFINPNKLILSRNYNYPVAGFQPVSKQVPKAGLDRNPKRFYVGLMGGIDVTTIEFQKTTKNGFDYGVLIGYQLGRRWAIEAAAFMDNKYYYTDGKHFYYDKLYMPPNSWITDVNGHCRMWDLSLGGIYSLGQTKKSGWFAAAGISSYLMKEENYDYTYYYATSGVSAVHSKSYANESQDLFSIINLSLGYTRRMGKIAELRVEPYMKLPIQGIGVGNLSMLSGGVHIGLTKKLF